MERGERIVVLCFALMFSAEMLWLLWVIFALSVITAGQRFVKVWRQAEQAARSLARRADRRRPALAGVEGGAGRPGGNLVGPGAPGPGCVDERFLLRAAGAQVAGPVAGAGTNGGWSGASASSGDAISAAAGDAGELTRR